ncbi:hypothetical protein MRX96_003787 [Rhipicephalus microplus]
MMRFEETRSERMEERKRGEGDKMRTSIADDSDERPARVAQRRAARVSTAPYAAYSSAPPRSAPFPTHNTIALNNWPPPSDPFLAASDLRQRRCKAWNCFTAHHDAHATSMQKA